MEMSNEEMFSASLLFHKRQRLLMLNKVIERNMKKTYINPAMETVKIATQQMLAMSVSETEVDGSKALGRDYDFDDEE